MFSLVIGKAAVDMIAQTRFTESQVEQLRSQQGPAVTDFQILPANLPIMTNTHAKYKSANIYLACFSQQCLTMSCAIVLLRVIGPNTAS